MTFTYDTIWKKVSPELTRELVAFWTEEKALLKSGNPELRAQQAVVAMRDEQGGIAAVCTAVIKTTPRLRQPLYYFRIFCAAKYRGEHTSLPMLLASQKALLEYNLGLESPEAIGMLIEVENRMIASRFNEAFWPRTGFSFIGYSPRGMVLRAYYFPGFALLPPAPLRRQQTAPGGAQAH